MRIAAHLLLLPALALCACASGPTLPYPEDQDRQSVMAGIQDARQRALQNDRLAMYVLGGNWCHDSVNFSAMLQQPAVADIVEEDYEVQFINIGFLENIREYVNLFDVPVIYGTPTVLIVDPGTGTLLNRESLSAWRNATNRQVSELTEYLQRYADAPAATDAEPSPALAQALRSIDDFERRQAERIYSAYAEVGPLLEAHEEGKPAPGFDLKWGNLASMRTAITKDLAALRQSAREQDAAGATEIALDFPEYALFND